MQYINPRASTQVFRRLLGYPERACDLIEKCARLRSLGAIGSAVLYFGICKVRSHFTFDMPLFTALLGLCSMDILVAAMNPGHFQSYTRSFRKTSPLMLETRCWAKEGSGSRSPSNIAFLRVPYRGREVQGVGVLATLLCQSTLSNTYLLFFCHHAPTFSHHQVR